MIRSPVKASWSERTTRVYRVLEDGDIPDAGSNDIGDVHTDDVFSLDKVPSGSRTTGYIDQAKFKALGSRCAREHG